MWAWFSYLLANDLLPHELAGLEHVGDVVDGTETLVFVFILLLQRERRKRERDSEIQDENERRGKQRGTERDKVIQTYYNTDFQPSLSSFLFLCRGPGSLSFFPTSLNPHCTVVYRSHSGVLSLGRWDEDWCHCSISIINTPA
jgi:hypothetical protein